MSRDRRRRGRWSPCCRSRGSGTARAAAPRDRAQRCCVAGVRALLHRDLRDAGQRLAVLLRTRRCRRRRRSRDARARASVGSACTRPARSSGTPSDLRERRRGDAGRPQDRLRRDRARSPIASRRRASTLGDDGRRSAPRRRAARATPRAASRSRSGNGASRCGPPSSRTMRADSGWMRRKSCAQRLARDLGERAGQLDAGRSAADDDERQQPALRRRDRSRARPLRTPAAPAAASRAHRRASSARARAPPTRGGRSTRAPRRSRRSGSRSAIGVAAVDRASTRRAPPASIARASASSTCDVLLAAQDPADRRRDVARRQRRGRDLIQQRLEQVVVVAIEQRDADRRAAPARAPRRARRIRRR